MTVFCIFAAVNSAAVLTVCLLHMDPCANCCCVHMLQRMLIRPVSVRYRVNLQAVCRCLPSPSAAGNSFPLRDKVPAFIRNQPPMELRSSVAYSKDLLILVCKQECPHPPPPPPHPGLGRGQKKQKRWSRSGTKREQVT